MVELEQYECDCCGMPGTELEYLEDEAMLYCWVCGYRTPTDIDPPARCRICGCTELHGCPEGCWWVEDDLCSGCAAGED